MNHTDEENRRIRNEKDGHEDIKATVRLALRFINDHIMNEQEALKYFNLPKPVFDKFKDMVAP